MLHHGITSDAVSQWEIASLFAFVADQTVCSIKQDGAFQKAYLRHAGPNTQKGAGLKQSLIDRWRIKVSIHTKQYGGRRKDDHVAKLWRSFIFKLIKSRNSKMTISVEHRVTLFNEHSSLYTCTCFSRELHWSSIYSTMWIWEIQY